jgi:hypothetical protein
VLGVRECFLQFTFLFIKFTPNIVNVAHFRARCDGGL